MVLIRWVLGRQDIRLLQRRRSLLLTLAAIVFAVLLFCEFFIYHIVIFQCSWPELKTTAHGAQEPLLKAMFLADTHLLGERRGHWLDKLRR
jgi:hypothetical protein